MKFSLRDKRFTSLDPAIQKEIAEKLFSAEKNIAVLRVVVILLNSFVYLFLFDKYIVIENLALFIIIAANAYGIFVLLFHPYKKYHLLVTSYFTSILDAVLIGLWIVATGGFDSPFYLLWFVSILAIAMRYSMAVTYRTTIVYAFLYCCIFWMDIYQYGKTPELSDLVLRIGYLVLVAILGALMTEEVIDQIEAKIKVLHSEQEVKQKKEQLIEAHTKLEERVEERTRELAESNKQLLRINEEIDNFVYSASHDLKSPILNMEALLEILEESKTGDSELEKGIREKLHMSVQKMKRTVSHLAEVAKAQKEVYDDVAPVLFEEVLADLISENEEILKRENVALEYNFNSAKVLTCSKTCLKSIMYNFLTNAIKYRHPERKPSIKFYSQLENNFTTLLIQDNGLGIDLQRNGKKLFTLFKRFHDHVEGAGIGLYMVKKLVEKYDGDIEVESEPGKGTTFKVRFKCTD